MLDGFDQHFPASAINLSNIDNFFLWNFFGKAGIQTRGIWVSRNNHCTVPPPRILDVFICYKLVSKKKTKDAISRTFNKETIFRLLFFTFTTFFWRHIFRVSCLMPHFPVITFIYLPSVFSVVLVTHDDAWILHFKNFLSFWHHLGKSRSPAQVVDRWMRGPKDSGSNSSWDIEAQSTISSSGWSIDEGSKRLRKMNHRVMQVS